jgi:hypothetical protein
MGLFLHVLHVGAPSNVLPAMVLVLGPLIIILQEERLQGIMVVETIVVIKGNALYVMEQEIALHVLDVVNVDLEGMDKK